jgi:hypothetical protein
LDRRSAIISLSVWREVALLLDWLSTAGNYFDPLAKIGGGLAALGGGWLWLSALYAKQAESMSGDWTNEGNVTGPPCTHSVRLQTAVTGRHVDGYVQATDANGGTPEIRLHGWRVGPYMRVKTTYLRRGDLVSYGIITLCYRASGTVKLLVFSYKLTPAVLFPVKARLWRIERREP